MKYLFLLISLILPQFLVGQFEEEFDDLKFDNLNALECKCYRYFSDFIKFENNFFSEKSIIKNSVESVTVKVIKAENSYSFPIIKYVYNENGYIKEEFEYDWIIDGFVPHHNTYQYNANGKVIKADIGFFEEIGKQYFLIQGTDTVELNVDYSEVIEYELPSIVSEDKTIRTYIDSEEYYYYEMNQLKRKVSQLNIYGKKVEFIDLYDENMKYKYDSNNRVVSVQDNDYLTKYSYKEINDTLYTIEYHHVDFKEENFDDTIKVYKIIAKNPITNQIYWQRIYTEDNELYLLKIYHYKYSDTLPSKIVEVGFDDKNHHIFKIIHEFNENSLPQFFSLEDLGETCKIQFFYTYRK